MYKGQSGMWSWLFHRVSGLAILIFLILHVVDISLLSYGPAVYNSGIVIFDNIVARLLSLALIAAVLFHAFNGVRIMLVDFWGKGTHLQKSMFAVVMVLTILLLIPTAFYVIGPAVPKLFAWLMHPVMSLVSGK